MEYLPALPKPTWIEDLLADPYFIKHMPEYGEHFDEVDFFGKLRHMRYSFHSCVAWTIEERYNR